MKFGIKLGGNKKRLSGLLTVGKKGKKKKVLVAARYKSCYYNTISCFKSVNVKIKKYN